MRVRQADGGNRTSFQSKSYEFWNAFSSLPERVAHSDSVVLQLRRTKQADVAREGGGRLAQTERRVLHPAECQGHFCFATEESKQSDSVVPSDGAGGLGENSTGRFWADDGGGADLPPVVGGWALFER